MIGWIIVASIWTHCEIVLPNSNAKSLPGWCPEAVLYNQSGLVFDNDLAIIRGTFAWILTILYMVYLLCACLACRKERKANNHDHGLGINLEASPELGVHSEEFFY